MNLLQGIPLGRYISCSTKGGLHVEGFLVDVSDETVTLRPVSVLEGHGWIAVRLDDISTAELWPESRVHMAFPWLDPKAEGNG